MRRSLYEVVDDAGLNPKHSGDKVRFYCYFCDQDGRSRTKGTNAIGYPESGWWSCYSCGRKGGAADIAALIGLMVTEVKTDRRTMPQPKSIAEFWTHHLASSQPKDAKRVVTTWLKDVRGWSEEHAYAGAEWSDIKVFDPETHGRMGEVGRSMCYRPKHRILGGIRDELGAIRTFTRQWDGTGDRPDVQRYNLSGELTGPLGSVLCYGSIESAVEAAQQGRPIFITEGLPDTLAAWALTRHLYAAVLGTFNTSTGPAVAWALSEQLGDRGYAADVYIVEQMDQEKKGVVASEVWRDAVISALSPRCGITRISMALAEGDMARTKGHVESGEYDLADWVADGGDLDRLLDVASELVKSRPRTVEELRRDMSDEMVMIVNDVTDSWRSTDVRRRVGTANPPAGGGKTTAALRVAHWAAQNEDPRLDIPWIGKVPRVLGLPDGEIPKGRRVLVSTSSHKLAMEKIGEFHEINGVDAQAVHLQGLMRVCKFKKSKALGRVYGAVGRRGVCGDPGASDRCPHAATCPGAQDHMIMPGQVGFGYHKTDVDVDLVIIDEDPGVMDIVEIEEAEVVSLFAAVGSAVDRRRAWWHKTNPDAQVVAQAIHAAFTRHADRHRFWISRGGANHARVIPDEDLRSILEEAADSISRDDIEAGTITREKARSAFMEMISRGFIGEDAVQPPRPKPGEIRDDFPGVAHLPSLAAFRVVRDMLRWMWAPESKISMGAQESGPRIDPKPVLTLNATKADDAYKLQWWSVRELPNAPLVVLDATGHLMQKQWTAAYHERVDVYPMPMAGRAPLKAIHYRTSISKKLISSDESLVLDRISGGLVDAVIGAMGPVPGKPNIGIITHKIIADGMMGRSKTDFGVKLRQMIEGMEKANGVAISAGYYGLDDRGTNRWKNVDAFVAIGDFIPNIGVTDAEAGYLGMTGDEHRDGLQASTVIQAMARSRYAVRPIGERAPIIVYMGKEEPPMDDVRWETMRPKSGPSIDAGGRDARGLAVRAAAELGIVGASVLKSLDRAVYPWSLWADVDLDEMSARHLQRCVEYAANLHKFETYVIGYAKGRVKLFARTREIAQSWVDVNLS